MHVTVFGYLCRDRNVLPDGQTSNIVGGKGLFTAAALARSGVTTDLITWLPDSDRELLLALDDYPVTTHIIPIPAGTVNTNTHRGDTTIATTIVDPYSIEPDDLDENMLVALNDSQVVHLAPDIQEKISLHTLEYLGGTLGLKLSADIGKYFRQLQSDGQLVPRWPWTDQAKFLQHFDIVFASKDDIAPLLDSGESYLSAARMLAEQGPNEVIITLGSQGSFMYVHDTNDAYDIPSFPPRQLVDPTGAGDTYIGAYLGHRLLSDNVIAAGKFGAMAASLKLNYTGPLQEPAETVEQRLNEIEK